MINTHPEAVLKFWFDAFRMHSESLAIQDASLPLFKQHCDNNTYGFTMHHFNIVAEFGRFPHHNETLKSASTAAEWAL